MSKAKLITAVCLLGVIILPLLSGCQEEQLTLIGADYDQTYDVSITVLERYGYTVTQAQCEDGTIKAKRAISVSTTTPGAGSANQFSSMVQSASDHRRMTNENETTSQAKEINLVLAISRLNNGVVVKVECGDSAGSYAGIKAITNAIKAYYDDGYLLRKRSP